MKILFAGSPAIAVDSIGALSAMECSGEDIQLAAILTNPDSPRGRKGDPVPSDLSAAAAAVSAERIAKGFPPIIQIKSEKADSRVREEIAALKCDLLICFAFGCIFGPKFLSLFPRGGINIHPSLLPKYRGPAPIPAAILNNETETGITIQTIAAEMDAGLILAREKIPLDGSETTESLGITVAKKAAQILPAFIREFIKGNVKGVPQEGDPVFSSMITKENGRIDWNLNAVDIDARVRAYYPWPLCYTSWHGEDIFILEGCVFDDMLPSHLVRDPLNPSIPLFTYQYEGFSRHLTGSILGMNECGILIQTGDGVYAVKKLQRQSKKAMDWKSFLNGARGFIGSRLE